MARIIDTRQPDPDGLFAGWTTGQFDAANPNRKERLALQHLREDLFRLKRKADRLTYLRMSIVEVTSETGAPALTSDDEQQLYEQTTDFANAFYACVGAFCSVAAKFARRVDAKANVPTRSVDKFLDWLVAWKKFPDAEEMAVFLQHCRDFRTVLAHAGQNQPFDWATTRIGDHPGQGIVIFGVVRSENQLPNGVEINDHSPEMRAWAEEHHDEGAKIHWAPPAPYEQEVMDALLNFVAMFGSLTSGSVWASENAHAGLSSESINVAPRTLDADDVAISSKPAPSEASL